MLIDGGTKDEDFFRLDSTSISYAIKSKSIIANISNKQNQIVYKNSISVGNWVNSIVKIDENHIAFGSYKKVTIANISDKQNPIVYEKSISVGDLVYSIVKIDENHIAFGGSDKKVTIANISDRKNPKIIASYKTLEDDIYEIKTNSSITIKSNNPLTKQKLYKYAWFVDSGGRCVPYYMLEDSDKVKFSEDRTSLVLFKKEIDN